MRHVGEAEAAIAIGIDRRAAGKMRLPDDDAVSHLPPRQVVSAFSRRPASPHPTMEPDPDEA